MDAPLEPRAVCISDCMICCMTTRLNITLPDVVAEKLRTASGNKPSEYIERAVTRQMLADDLRRLAEFEAKNGGPDLSFELGWEQGAAE